MNDYFATTVLFTLFFVIDPIGLIPVFIVYLSEYEKKQRTRIILKTIFISIFISLFFIFLGEYILKYLSISTGSFLIAGGILLFIISMEMLFGTPSRVKMRDKEDDCTNTEITKDVSVFPLAIPMLCGPGNIAALLMFRSQAGIDHEKLIILIGLVILVFLISMIIMIFTKPIESFLGNTGISVVQRMTGLILSALAIQFIVNGLKGLKIISQNI